MNTKEVAAAYRTISQGFFELAVAIETAASSGAQAAEGRAVVAPARPETEPEWLPPLEEQEAAYKANPITTPIDAGLPRAAKPPAPKPEGSLAMCPKHRVPYTQGTYGPYCKERTDDPAWGKEKGDVLWCKITPKNVDVWLRQHSGVPA